MISFYFNTKHWEIFIDWRKKYGDVYTYWSGEQPVVSVNDYDTIVETFIKDGTSYEGRIDEKEFNDVFIGGKINAKKKGERWSSHVSPQPLTQYPNKSMPSILLTPQN